MAYRSFRIGDKVVVRATVTAPANNAYGSRVVGIAIQDRPSGACTATTFAPISEVARPDEAASLFDPVTIAPADPEPLPER